MKTYDEIAREYDEMKRKGTEIDNLVPVRARVAKNPRTVFSIRLARGELGQLSDAAKKRGLKVSDFVRLAALSAARGELGLEPGVQAETIGRVQEQVEELATTVRKLGVV